MVVLELLDASTNARFTLSATTLLRDLQPYGNCSNHVLERQEDLVPRSLGIGGFLPVVGGIRNSSTYSPTLLKSQRRHPVAQFISPTKKTNQKIEVPQVVELYRSTLGFVDRANAYRLRYPLHHRVPKHTRAQFYGMLGIAIVNSWILFKKVNKLQKYSYRTYLLQLIRAMAEAGGSLRRRATKNRIHRKTTSISVGTMKQMPHVPLHGSSSRGTCAQCKQRMEKACPRGGVSWYCAGCISADGSRVWYHLSAEKNCFAEAHFSGMKKMREGRGLLCFFWTLNFFFFFCCI
jgi:hypothetical protein